VEQIQQYLESWRAHEIHNFEEDVAPTVGQKAATYGALVDRMVTEMQTDARAFAEEEERLQQRVAGLVQGINRLKGEAEAGTRHWAAEEERVIKLVGGHRANVIRSSRKLLQDQERDAGRQHKQQSLSMLTALRDLR
jgi:hypothetical protein